MVSYKEREVPLVFSAVSEKALRGKKKTYVVDVVTRDGNNSILNTEREVGEVSITVKNVTTVDQRLGGARDIGVVVRNDSGGQVDEGGAGVSDADNGLVDKVIVADAVAGGGELPVAGQLGHGGVGEVAGVSGAVDPADVVRAG